MQLNPLARLTLTVLSMIVFSACGGGGGGGGGTNSHSSISHLAALQPGQSVTLSADSDIYVPAGTSIVSPNGSTITINGSNNSVNVVVNSTVTAPANATGPANNLVTVAATASLTQIPAANVSVLAGDNTVTGAATADGQGTQAIFWGGGRMAIDPITGNIIVTDRGELRKVTPTGQVTTYMNAGLLLGSDGVASDQSGNVFTTGDNLTASPVAWNAFAQEFSATEVVTPINPSFESSPTNPNYGLGGLAIDGGGNLFFADEVNNKIWKITPMGEASYFAGSGVAGAADGTGIAASFNNPRDIAIDRAGSFYVIDAGNAAIRKISPAGDVTTFASNLPNDMTAIAIDPAGNIYFASNVTIYRISPTGISSIVTTIANPISSIVADGNSNIYVEYWGAKAGILKISL